MNTLPSQESINPCIVAKSAEQSVGCVYWFPICGLLLRRFRPTKSTQCLGLRRGAKLRQHFETSVGYIAKPGIDGPPYHWKEHGLVCCLCVLDFKYWLFVVAFRCNKVGRGRAVQLWVCWWSLAKSRELSLVSTASVGIRVLAFCCSIADKVNKAMRTMSHKVLPSTLAPNTSRVKEVEQRHQQPLLDCTLHPTLLFQV